MKKLIFVSSVQKELAAERRAMKNYILGDALLGRFFKVFLFEDLPASGRRADKVYLAEVIERVGTTGKGTVYVLGKRASKGPKGPSPTEAIGPETAQPAQAKQRPRTRKRTVKRQASRRMKDDKE